MTEHIRQKPNRIFLDVFALFRVKQVNNTVENSSLDELITTVDGITSDVAECPDDVIFDLVDTVFIEKSIKLK